MPTRSQAVIAISSLMLKNNLVNPFRYLETVHSMWIVYPNSLRWLLFEIYCPHFSIPHQLDQKSVTERHFGANCSNFSKSTSLYIRQVYHPLWRHHSRGRVVWNNFLFKVRVRADNSSIPGSSVTSYERNFKTL